MKQYFRFHLISFLFSRGNKFTNMLSPLLSPTSSRKPQPPSSSQQSGPQQYSSTSRLNNLSTTASQGSPNMSRQISRSSEDISKKGQATSSSGGSSGLKNVATNFLEVDFPSNQSSLQKDLDLATHVLEEGAVETAAIIEKGVLNPFSKLTRGLEAVLKGQTEMTQEAVTDQALSSEDVLIGGSSSPSKVVSHNNQAANALLKIKIAEANSQTNVLLI